jgi:hypothetical protein
MLSKPVIMSLCLRAPKNEDRAGTEVLLLHERIHISEEILARLGLQVKNPPRLRSVTFIVSPRS